LRVEPRSHRHRHHHREDEQEREREWEEVVAPVGGGKKLRMSAEEGGAVPCLVLAMGFFFRKERGIDKLSKRKKREER